MSPGKGAKRLLSADGGVWSLNVAIVAASVLLLAGPVQHLPEFDAGVHIPWWGLALGCLAAERCVVHLHFRRSAHSFSLDSGGAVDLARSSWSRSSWSTSWTK